MNDEQMKKSIIQFAKSLEGAVIHTNANDNLKFIDESKRKAKEHEWVYHCTNAEAFLNILRSREFWLTNLQYVNDKDEAKRIGAKEYDHTFYVSSFTYDPVIDNEHWKEYGTLKNGVLVAVKQEWFEPKAFFIDYKGNHTDIDFLEIYPSCKLAQESRREKFVLNREVINPFFIGDFGFYQVVYDDDMVTNIFSPSSITGDFGEIKGMSVIPEVAGIVKNKKGMCQRNNEKPYEKVWESEKEVRLKVRIHQLDHVEDGNEYHDGMIMPATLRNVAVPLNSEAFSELRIGFSPEFEDKRGYIEKLNNAFPDIKVLPLTSK